MTDTIRELFRFKKIRGKLFILTTVITLVPMLFISVAVYQISADRFMKNAEKHTLAAGGIANHYLNQIALDLNDLFNVIISSSQIQCSLTGAKDQVCQNIQIASDDGDYSYMKNTYRIGNAMNSITQSKDYVVHYSIYHMTAPPEWRVFGSYINPDEARGWYDELAASGQVLIRDNESLDQNMKTNPSTMLVGRLLRRTSGDFSPLGFILLEIDKGRFFEGLSFLKTDEQARLMIADREGHMLYSLPELPEERQTNERLLSETRSRNPNAGQFVSIEDKWMSSLQRSTPYDWSLVYSTDAKSLSADARSIRAITIWILLGTLVAGLLLADWISGTIRRPLHRLSRLIKVSGMIAPPPADRFDPEDEVGQIGQRFIRMTQENHALNQQVYNALKKSKQAEIHALQAQINPHFLYNTLESLKWLAFSRRQFEISGVIDKLGKYFRLTINKGSQMIPVAQELEHVMAYVEVQNFRYENRFDCFLALEADLSAYRVPKFVLQPIVENAIYHGLKEKEGPGSIVISGEVLEGTLLFHITYDGQGMAPERIEELTRALEQEETSATYGLKNVHDRLKLRYGEGFGVRIRSSLGLYTTITLAMPAIEEEEQGDDEHRDQSADRGR
ncbi:sensor histidine kinase [Cohnella sp. REN36]|uniref:cache domain-containing sensor histidine kinase n=1 Tax=Cohnella sp. REN36 TaxID=2887347 RepID=UPI001D145435|nr:sensor histidine kinase [Cohnella sp. REN36]MCC3376318.1 sensor histidine kinase [Cohnella sp. REN36]